MKQVIFIYLFLMLAYQTGICQNRIAKQLGYIETEMTLPYKAYKDMESRGRLYAFPIDLVVGNATFEDFVWTDLALSQKHSIEIKPESGNNWMVCYIDRKFKTNNQDYILFSVVFGVFDFSKQAIITSDKNGNYIDSISTGAQITCKKGELYPMKWEITEDLTVKTYQLKPTSSTPILYNSDIPDTLQAQRIDRTYSIDSNGEFTEVETKYYEPRNYSKEKFLDKGYDISTGNEIYITPKKIEPAPPVFDN